MFPDIIHITPDSTKLFPDARKLSPENRKLSPENNFVVPGVVFLLSCFTWTFPENDNAMRLSKTNKNKEKPTKQKGFTNKNLFFPVRFGFYWFLNDAERMLFCRGPNAMTTIT